MRQFVPAIISTLLMLLALAVLTAISVDARGQPATVQTVAPSRPDGAQEDVRMERIGEGVYRFTTAFDGWARETNSAAIVGRDGVLLFDTNTRPSTARAVLARLRTVTDRPVRWIVNSHWHPDHWLGNEVFAEAFPGVEIIATGRTAQFMRNVGPSLPSLFVSGLRRQRDAPREADPEARAAQLARIHQHERLVEETSRLRWTYPTRTYRDRMTLDLGGREVRLMSITGDTTHATIAFLPAERLLLTGDALVHPLSWPASGHAITPWMESLRAMAALEPRLVAPGHGKILRGTAYLNIVADFMAEMIRQVQTALAGGALTVEEVQARVDLSAFRDRLGDGEADYASTFAAMMPAFVRKAALDQRDGVDLRRRRKA